MKNTSECGKFSCRGGTASRHPSPALAQLEHGDKSSPEPRQPIALGSKATERGIKSEVGEHFGTLQRLGKAESKVTFLPFVDLGCGDSALASMGTYLPPLEEP